MSTPPADQSHRAVLGAMLADQRVVPACLERLSDEDFDQGWLRMTFTAIRELHEAGMPSDPLNVLRQMQNTGRLRSTDGAIGSFLHDLYDQAYLPAVPEADIATILEAAYRRACWKATVRIQQAIQEWPLAGLVATIDRELSASMVARDRLAETTPKAAEPVPMQGLTGLAEILNAIPTRDQQT